jgi:hypothetical protein
MNQLFRNRLVVKNAFSIWLLAFCDKSGLMPMAIGQKLKAFFPIPEYIFFIHLRSAA